MSDRDGVAALVQVRAAFGAGVPFQVVPDGIAVPTAWSPPRDAGPERFRTMTSGSSGEPRCVERTHRSWIASFEVAAAGWHRGPGERVAVLGRLGHSLPLYAALEALHLGARLDLLAGLRPGRALQALAEREATLLYATPTQLRLLAGGRRHPAPVASVRNLLVGGAKLDARTRDAAMALFPSALIREFYGASETSFVTIADAATPADAVGRAFPGVSIEIRDMEGRCVEDEAVGEIWVRSPYLFERYAAGASADTRRDGDFLTIGEFGRLHRDGTLSLAGRRSRMVTIADRNVFPDAVEAFLLRQPGVAEAAVVPVPDRLRGHRLVGFVSTASKAAVPDLLPACRAAFGGLAAPAAIVALEEWPYLASGKTDLVALQSSARGAAD